MTACRHPYRVILAAGRQTCVWKCRDCPHWARETWQTFDGLPTAPAGVLDEARVLRQTGKKDVRPSSNN